MLATSIWRHSVACCGSFCRTQSTFGRQWLSQRGCRPGVGNGYDHGNPLVIHRSSIEISILCGHDSKILSIIGIVSYWDNPHRLKYSAHSYDNYGTLSQSHEVELHLVGSGHAPSCLRTQLLNGSRFQACPSQWQAWLSKEQHGAKRWYNGDAMMICFYSWAVFKAPCWLMIVRRLHSDYSICWWLSDYHNLLWGSLWTNQYDITESLELWHGIKLKDSSGSRSFLMWCVLLSTPCCSTSIFHLFS